jgi:hypothetical protein
MSLRFRRSFRIAPGIRMNVGLRGASLSLGGRGHHLTVGSSGTSASVGLPGTGVSYTMRSPRGIAARHHKQLDAGSSGKVEIGVRVHLNEDGTISFLDESGSSLESKLVSKFLSQQAETVRTWLEKYADSVNADTKSLIEIHYDTPQPTYLSRFQREPFGQAQPQPPALTSFGLSEPMPPQDRRPGIFTRLFPGALKRHERKRAAAAVDFEIAHKLWLENKTTHDRVQQEIRIDFENTFRDWRDRKVAYERAEEERAAEHEQRLLTDSGFMGSFVEHELSKLHWPRETNVSFEVTDSVTAFLDVDLPEIEDFPKRIAIVSANGKRIHFKDKSETALREEYARHIHGIAFRLAGGVFSILPAIKTVMVSGYSERVQAQIGDDEDEYLYSVRIPRDGFSKINFSRLDHVDPVAALAAFEMRRSMTKTGIFKAIEPMTP